LKEQLCNYLTFWSFKTAYVFCLSVFTNFSMYRLRTYCKILDSHGSHHEEQFSMVLRHVTLKNLSTLSGTRCLCLHGRRKHTSDTLIYIYHGIQCYNMKVIFIVTAMRILSLEYIYIYIYIYMRFSLTRLALHVMLMALQIATVSCYGIKLSRTMSKY